MGVISPHTFSTVVIGKTMTEIETKAHAAADAYFEDRMYEIVSLDVEEWMLIDGRTSAGWSRASVVARLI